MAAETYPLEHFYYGQFVREGKPDGELRLLASSAGIKPEQVAECLKQALVPPLVGVPKGSWALLRGKTLPFILAQSQLGAAGQAMLHFAIVPVEALRALGGNLKAVMALVEEAMPTYDRLGPTLPPLALAQAGPPAAEAQVDDILELMTYAHNRMDTIEKLLAALVKNVPIVVQGASRELQPRVGFVEGLLALLPPPARFGVTFATATVPSTKVEAQIRFFSDDAPPAETLVYNWEKGAISGKTVENEYSRFIISQLRLDAELVTQQTRALTPVASWRMKRGESLTEAMAYASYRLKLDNAVMTNLPVEVDDVSKVLANDPTLPEDVRFAYARHLLALTLALGDSKPADPLAIMLREQPTLEKAVLQHMSESLRDGKPGTVYAMLSRWLANPLGPQGNQWIDLTHEAALQTMDALVKAQDVAGINSFLERLEETNPGVAIGRIVPKLVEKAVPISVRDAALVKTTFLLAVRYLETTLLKRLLDAKAFVGMLPKSVARLTPYLSGEDANPAPGGLLPEVAAEFGDKWRQEVLMRLAEIALLVSRTDLLDPPTLAGLVQVALSPLGVHYDQVLRWMVLNLSKRDDYLKGLPAPGPRYLVQILLARGAYAELAAQMHNLARLLYPGDLQATYALMVERLFAETPIATDEVPTALETIEKSGIKQLPLVMAYIGTLEAHEWSPTLEKVATDTTAALFGNRTLLKVIDPKAMMALLNFHVKRKDVSNAVRVASLFPMVAVEEAGRGTAMMAQMYKQMGWDDRVRASALELLRRYIRLSEDEAARKAMEHFKRELGADIETALQATHMMRRLMGESDFEHFALVVHTAANFLEDTAAAYVDKNNIPSPRSLMGDLDSLPGGLSDDERRGIMEDVLAIGKALIRLAEQYRAQRPRDVDKHITQLLTAQAEPRNALDVFWLMGGYFSQGNRHRANLERKAKAHVLGERSAPIVKQELRMIRPLLESTVHAFPSNKAIGVTTAALRGEMESLWGELSLHTQRQLVRDLASDLQRTPELVVYIYEHGDPKALDDSGSGRKLEANQQQPRNTLEFYRFMSGYYKSLIS